MFGKALAHFDVWLDPESIGAWGQWHFVGCGKVPKIFLKSSWPSQFSQVVWDCRLPVLLQNGEVTTSSQQLELLCPYSDLTKDRALVFYASKCLAPSDELGDFIDLSMDFGIFYFWLRGQEKHPIRWNCWSKWSKYEDSGISWVEERQPKSFLE